MTFSPRCPINASVNGQIRKSCFLSLLALCLSGCEGCRNKASQNQSPVQRGGTLVVGLKAEPDSPIVYLSKGVESAWVANRTLPRLARDIPPGSGEAAGFKPELADRWEWQDDGRTLTFKWRKLALLLPYISMQSNI